MELSKILILEDEFINLMSLKLDVSNLGYDIVGTAMSVDEALEILEKEEVHIVLLDINVKGDKTGIWLANKINEDYGLPFIFITGYGNRDVIDQAVKTKPIAYIQKPYSPSELYSSLQIAKLKISNAGNLEQMEQTKASIPIKKEDLPDTIFQKNGDKVEKIIIADILYIISEKNYVKLIMKDREILIRGSLKDWLEKLEKYNSFIQVHRSYIINHSYINSLRKGFVYLDEYKIPISPKYKADLYDLLDIQY